MDPLVAAVFAFTYLGMFLGRIPGLALDRTGLALLGAIVLLASGRLDAPAAAASVDLPTLGLLLGLMVISAQLRLGGFYDYVTRRIGTAPLDPPRLLALAVGVLGLLSAVLGNDIICLAVTPVLAAACTSRGLNPVPFLLALACAANVGSALTLIGNPQNVLIGEALDLSFAGYSALAALPVLLGLAVVWAVIAYLYRGRWDAPAALAPHRRAEDAVPFDRWQTAKGLTVTALLVLAFLLTGWPRDIAALAAAGVLLTSRRLHSRAMLGLVDWQLIVLFIGLFVVNGAFMQAGGTQLLLGALQGLGLDPAQPGPLLALTVVLSNLVSNVPAVMLLLPFAEGPLAGPLLALGSTLAGNLLIVGSIANIIVVDEAQRLGLRIGWREHARVGVPVTVLTLVVALVWVLVVT